MNFKRKKPRVRTSRGYSRRAGKERFEKYKYRSCWMNWWPGWWDVIYHRRPHRRHNAEVEGRILRMGIDPDAAVWPVSKKPHNYYW